MAVMVLPDTAGVSLTNMRASGLRTVESRERGREIKLVSRLVIPRWIPFLNFGLYVSYCYLRQLILLKASTGFSSVGQVHSYCLSSFNDSIHMSSLFCSEGRKQNSYLLSHVVYSGRSLHKALIWEQTGQYMY